MVNELKPLGLEKPEVDVLVRLVNYTIKVAHQEKQKKTATKCAKQLQDLISYTSALEGTFDSFSDKLYKLFKEKNNIQISEIIDLLYSCAQEKGCLTIEEEIEDTDPYAYGSLYGLC